MKPLILCLLFVSINAFAQSDSGTAAVGPKAFACTSQERFESAVDYIKQKDEALFNKLFNSRRPTCVALSEGEKVVVRSRSMWSTVIRRKGSETLLYTNQGAFK